MIIRVTPPYQCSYQISTSYTLWFLRYGPNKIFQGQGHDGKVKGQSNYDKAQLYPLTNAPTKYQHPTPIVTEI